jgi:hypothetical protein
VSGSEHFGSCLCGETTYKVAGQLDEVALCHCSQCRRANGGAFNVAVIVDSALVRFVAQSHLREYMASAGKYRAFCGQCGSPIYSRRDDLPDTLRLRGGAIVDLPLPGRLHHIEYASRWRWIDHMFDAPKFEGV